MRAFVTGATGFIGRHLVRRLVNEGLAVRCLVRTTSQRDVLESLGVELVEGDLSDPRPLAGWLRDCQVIYHLAAKTSAWMARQLNQVNALGTHHLLEACTGLTIPPVVLLVSSLAAVGTSSPRHWRQGDEPPRPVSDYGRSKRGSERAAERFAHLLPISIVRPGIVFGQENRETLPIFRSVVRLRVHAVPTLFPSRVALVHYQDLIELMLAVVERGTRLPASLPDGLASGFCFAADPQCPTYVQWGRMIAKAADRPPPFILPVPEPLLWTAAGFSQLVQARQGKTDTFNLDKIREATAGQWVCQVDKCYRQLGFYHRSTLDQRLGETVEWYVQHGWI